MVAEKIRDHFGEQLVDIHNIADTPVELMAHYQYLILGIPTWDYGELQEDWEAVWDELDQVDLTGKTVALFGLGDQVGYPQWFQDALGYLWAKVIHMGAKVVGYWPNEGYQFEQSKGLTADHSHFYGLALDEDNQFDLTEQRLSHWCNQLAAEFNC